ncbi:hypothetical protein ACOJAI_14010, partial [Corynebacterium striatum]|uniref:hypothetical protein n=1 Tax=Corynebacterium striatum TaxID=43770 RepID=UPI003B5B6EDA
MTVPPTRKPGTNYADYRYQLRRTGTLAEVAASDKAPGNDIQAIQQDTPHADSSTVMPSSTGVNALWP